MDSYEKCEHCKELYNLSTHKPIIFPECLDTVCLECIKDKVLQNKVQEGQFKCCIDQTHIVKIDPNNLDLMKLNPTIKRKLEAQTVIPMFCEIHQTQMAKYLIQNMSQIVCSLCITDIEQIEQNKSNIREISKNGLKRYAEKSIEFLEEGIGKYKTLQQQLKRITDENFQLTPFKLRETFWSNKLTLQNCLNDRNMDDELNELIKLSFPGIKENLQPQSEKDELTFEDYQLLKRKPKSDLSLSQSIFQQRINIEVQKHKNSFLQSHIKEWSKTKFQLLYQASSYYYSVGEFHRHCDNKGPTVTFYQSKFGQIFGVYSSISIDAYNRVKQDDPELFVFQLDKKTIHHNLDPKQNTFHSDWYFNSPGIINELSVTNIKAGNQTEIICSTQNFGNSFQLPEGIQIGSILAQTYLGGAVKFKITEVEVYSVT